MFQFLIKEHIQREEQGLLDEEFALAYAVLHQPKPAPDTREVVAAPCASSPDMWFSKKHVAQAIEVCQTCTIKRECLATALRYGVEEGVWGGVHFV